MDFNVQLYITHTIGFLITLWILKKFAWGPILGLLDERREKIIGEFQKIEDGQAEVEKLTAEYNAKLSQIDDERRAKITEAVSQAKVIADEIKTAANKEAKVIADKAKSEIERDVAKAKVQLKDDMVTITVKAASKIINEKLDDNKHRELIANFIDGVEKV